MQTLKVTFFKALNVQSKTRSVLINYEVIPALLTSITELMRPDEFFALDSEWHWIFDCPQFSEFRAQRPFFSKNLESAQEKKEFATLGDLCRLLVATRNDSRIGFSLASFLRQARLARKGWSEEVCAGGRLSVPPHWTHDIFLDPPSDAEFVENFEEFFNDGMPFHASTGLLLL